ncbi:MAG TPA: PLD nuclease N-terminal domain-containing protein [Acidimicrobiales bacterium]
MPDIVAGVIGIALVFIWIYCLYDVVTTHDGLVRNLPKIAWFVIVLLIPDLGSILWLAFGRPRIQSQRIVTFDGRHARAASTGPSELDMSGLDHLHPVVREREELARLRMMQAQLQRRENELRQRGLGESADS